MTNYSKLSNAIRYTDPSAVARLRTAGSKARDARRAPIDDPDTDKELTDHARAAIRHRMRRDPELVLSKAARAAKRTARAAARQIEDGLHEGEVALRQYHEDRMAPDTRTEENIPDAAQLYADRIQDIRTVEPHEEWDIRAESLARRARHEARGLEQSTPADIAEPANETQGWWAGVVRQQDNKAHASTVEPASATDDPRTPAGRGYKNRREKVEATEAAGNISSKNSHVTRAERDKRPTRPCINQGGR